MPASAPLRCRNALGIQCVRDLTEGLPTSLIITMRLRVAGGGTGDDQASPLLL